MAANRHPESEPALPASESSLASVVGSNLAAAVSIAAQAGARIDDVNEVFFEVLTRIEEISTLNAILDLVESVFLRALFHELKHISHQVYYHDTDDATKVAHFQNACALVEEYAPQAKQLEVAVLISTSHQYHLSYVSSPKKDLFRRWHCCLRDLIARTPLGELLHHPAARLPRVRWRLRVGFFGIDKLQKFSSVYRDRMNVIQGLDSRRFETFLIVSAQYAASPPRDLAGADLLWGSVDHVVGCDVHDLRAVLTQVGELHLDVLVYPEIGMHPLTCLTAYARLAPVQVATWGHSLTSGIPTVDYYFSSAWYEPTDAEANYSETLVQMRSLCTSYPDLSIKHRVRKGGADYTSTLEVLPPPPTKLVCCMQTSCKVNLHFLRRTMPRILDGAPDAVFLFMREHFASATRDAISEALAGQVLFLPTLLFGTFRTVIARSTILLDLHPFGGCNTALDSFLEGRIIVTLPGSELPGRFTQGFYRRMGVVDPIASTEDEYVDLAVRFLNDSKERRRVERLIEKRRSVLFNDQASVAEWEDTLLLVSRPWVTLMRRKGGDRAGEDKRACAGWLPRLEFRGCFGCVCTV